MNSNRLTRTRFACAVCAALASLTAPAWAKETDQFIAGWTELSDAAPALNAYLNEQFEAVLAERRDAGYVDRRAEVIDAFYRHLFVSGAASRLKNWMRDAEDIALYPPRTVSDSEYRKQSIYRSLAFPGPLPLGRTMRIGHVHLGEDKLGHFFGPGRRYFRLYLRLMALGLTHDEAKERVIQRGNRMEQTVLGIWADGVFSPADLEANYQGFRMARDLAREDDPYLEPEGNGWRLVKPIDIRPYITPHFDESYNLNYYTGRRRDVVFNAYHEEYCEGPVPEPTVRRHALYDQYEPSRAMVDLREFLAEIFGDDHLDRTLTNHFTCTD